METLIRIFWKYLAGDGIKKSSDKLFNKRMSICRSNTCGVYQKPFKIKALERCGDCGCFLNVKARMDEPFIACPKKLW
jgi:hypothetical protein